MNLRPMKSAGRGSRLIWLAALLIGASAALGPLGASAAAPPNKVCPGFTSHKLVKAPPIGFAVLVETIVLNDCTIQIKPERTVPIAFLASVGGGIQHGSNHNPHRAGDPVATMYQRTWDLNGLNLLNALYTSYDWTGDGVGVTSNNQWNTTIYHTEAPPSRGWWLDYQTLNYRDDLGGCEGCWFRTLAGLAGYGYQGVFDPLGLLFYNTYNNAVSGIADGTFQCAMSYTWRLTAPGWHKQDWCAYGYNP